MTLFCYNLCMTSEKEEQIWKKVHANQHQQNQQLKPLREARLAIELTILMEQALAAMDAESAVRLEKIGELLQGSGLFEDNICLPYYTTSLSETLISDYITETKEGAVGAADYRLYDFNTARGKPTIEGLAAEREKLSKTAKKIEQKLQMDYDKKIAEQMASNQNWRKANSD